MLRSITRFLWSVLGLFIIVSIFLVTLYRDVPPPATPRMLLPLAGGHAVERSWRGLDRISPFLLKAVIAGEDRKFCHHRGFDLEGAREPNQSEQVRLPVAGTISMQTARNVFLWPGSDWAVNTLDAYFTALIELVWGKQRIIEVYLNVVEWAPDIYGAEAAAEHYFHKPAAQLSPYEAVRLAAVLPDPLDRSAKRPEPQVESRSRLIVEQIPGLPVWEPLPCGRPL